MGVIISNGNTNLSTTNGFYNVESYNLNPFNGGQGTGTSISSALALPVTFANAGNCQGIVLYLDSTSDIGSNLNSDRGVQVTLQENVASVWTDRATVTLTIGQINSSSTNRMAGAYIVPFTGGTFPYAVTNAASTWRFSIVQTGGTTGTWVLRGSATSTPAYATWCDNAHTFANGDTVIFKDIVTIDQSATFGGVTQAGATTNNPICAVICRSLSPSISTMKLKWASSPAASYTLTPQGNIVVSHDGGVAIGTSAARIPIAQQAIIDFGATATNGFVTAGLTGTSGNVSGKEFIYIFGEIPSGKSLTTTFPGAIAAAATSFTSASATSWVNGDLISIGRRTTKSASATLAERTEFTVTSTSGTTVNFTPAIQASQGRSAGGTACLLSGYGVKIMASTAQRTLILPHTVMQIDGVEFVNIGITGWSAINLSPGSTGANGTLNDPAFSDSCYIKNSTARNNLSNGSSFFTTALTRDGFTIDKVYVNNLDIAATSILSYFPNWFSSGTFTLSNCVQTMSYHNSTGIFGSVNIGAATRSVITSNVFENTDWAFIILNGVASTLSNNTFWGANGANSSWGAVYIGTYLAPVAWNANSFQNNLVGINISSGTTSAVTSTNDLFSTVTANTTDILVNTGGLIDVLFDTASLSTLDTTSITGCVNGSKLRFVAYNTVVGDDRTYTPYGIYQYQASVYATLGHAGKFTPLSATNPVYVRTSARGYSGQLLTVSTKMTKNSVYGASSTPYIKLSGLGMTTVTTSMSATTKTITGATNATPIVITATSHGYNNGDQVFIDSVGGNTAANGSFVVANKTTNTFELTDSLGNNIAGNGAYTSGGGVCKWETLTATGTPTSSGDADIELGAYLPNASSVAYFDDIKPTITPFSTGTQEIWYKAEPSRFIVATSSTALGDWTDDPFVNSSVKEATALAYTGITLTTSTGTVSLSTSHTAQEVYMYVKAKCRNLAIPNIYFTTADGTNWATATTSGANMTLTSASLTGTGTINMQGNILIATGTGTTTLTVSNGTVRLNTPGTISIPINGVTVDFIANGTYDFRSDVITGTTTLTDSVVSTVTAQFPVGPTVVNSDPTHITLSQSTAVTIVVSGITAGSRIQVYDVTNSTELTNAIVSGTTSTTNYTFTSNVSIRIRLAYTSGTSAMQFIETTQPLTSAGLTYSVSQVADTTYNSNAIDGSALTEFSVTGTTIKILISSGGADTLNKAYAWWQYLFTTASGIRDQVNSNFTAVDTAHYIFANGQQLKNTSGSVLMITGGIVHDGSGSVANCIDTTGSNIYLVANNVETYAVGSGLTGAQDALLTDIDSVVNNLSSGSGLTVGQFLALK